MTTGGRIAIGFVASAIAILATTGHHGDITDNDRAPTCHEDQSCWNPATMGNGVGFVCRIEPSDTPEGYEIIAYHDIRTATGPGFTVPCPPTIKGG